MTECVQWSMNVEKRKSLRNREGSPAFGNRQREVCTEKSGHTDPKEGECSSL